MESMGFFVSGGHVDGYDDARPTESIAKNLQQVSAQSFYKKHDEVVRKAFREYLGRDLTAEDMEKCHTLARPDGEVIFYNGVSIVFMAKPTMSQDGDISKITQQYVMLAERAK